MNAPGGGLMLEAPIQRIGVFRALMLGDMLCAVPALRALRAAYPTAHISLVGLPWARSLVERLPYVDELIAFPGYPGLPEQAPDLAALPAFLGQVQAQRFDLALQLHGSGVIANPLVVSFGARQNAGFFDSRAWVPPADGGRFIPWPEGGHEIHRLLALTDALGIGRQGTDLEYPLRDVDREELAALCPTLVDRPYVCIHPGAQLASRRWLPQRFAAVADALAEQGYQIVLTGTQLEWQLADWVMAEMSHRAISLVGRTSLWTLGALIEGAECLICNDTGVSHVAAALGTPSVVVSCGGDAARWAPLDGDLHRVLWADMPCRPCAHAECPETVGCAARIAVEQVLTAVERSKFRLVEIPAVSAA